MPLHFGVGGLHGRKGNYRGSCNGPTTGVVPASRAFYGRMQGQRIRPHRTSRVQRGYRNTRPAASHRSPAGARTFLFRRIAKQPQSGKHLRPILGRKSTHPEPGNMSRYASEPRKLRLRPGNRHEPPGAGRHVRSTLPTARVSRNAAAGSAGDGAVRFFFQPEFLERFLIPPTLRSKAPVPFHADKMFAEVKRRALG